MNQTEQTKIAKAKEDAIASRVGAGKGKLGLETAVKKIEAIDQPSEHVATEAGSVKFRATRTLKITDEAKIRDSLRPAVETGLVSLANGGFLAP